MFCKRGYQPRPVLSTTLCQYHPLPYHCPQMEKACLHWAGFLGKRLGCWFGLVWAAPERRPLPVPGHFIEPGSQPRLAAGCVVLVENALLDRLVQRARRRPDRPFGRLHVVAGHGPFRSTHRRAGRSPLAVVPLVTLHLFPCGLARRQWSLPVFSPGSVRCGRYYSPIPGPFQLPGSAPIGILPRGSPRPKRPGSLRCGHGPG